MWAMIGMCIAMAIWTSGLLYVSVRAEKKGPPAAGPGEENAEEEPAVLMGPNESVKA